MQLLLLLLLLLFPGKYYTLSKRSEFFRIQLKIEDTGVSNIAHLYSSST